MEYLEFHKSQSSDPDTARRNISVLLKFFGGRPIDEIRRKDIKNVFASRRLAGVKGSTCNRNGATLSGIFSYALDQEYVDENPMRGIRRFPESSGRARFLYPVEAGALLRAAVEQHVRRFILLGLYTGARPSEILRIRRRDLDVARENVHLFAAPGKNRKGRDVPMAPALIEHISRWKPMAPDAPVIQWRGEPVHDITTGFFDARDRAALGRDVITYTLRHTYASWFMLNGGDLYRLKELLGHASITMTERYAHLSPAFVKRGVQFVGPPSDCTPPSPVEH